MIIGTVTARREATIRFAVRGPGDQEQEIEAVVDTGFNSALTLPTRLIGVLGLRWREFRRAILGDGGTQVFQVYDAVVVWGGQERHVPAYAADMQPVVGMSLLYGHDLHIEVVDGGVVTIQPLEGGRA